MSGDVVLKFIMQDETALPGGTRGKGLIPYLRSLKDEKPDPRAQVIADVFAGVTNRMESGYLFSESAEMTQDGLAEKGGKRRG